jgi:hypothetical protein
MWHAAPVSAAYPHHGWAFDLVSDDPAAREAALNRHRDLLRQSALGRKWQNHVWALAASPAPDDPALAAEMQRARQMTDAARHESLYGPLDDFLSAQGRDDPGAAESGLPFVLLFLAWERSHPSEWRDERQHTGSPWSTKELLLARAGQSPIPEQYQVAMTGLVLAAVAGPYRCKDWMYAGVAQRLDNIHLRERLAELASGGGPDPLPRLRAQFVGHVLAHPDVHVTRGTWRRWANGSSPETVGPHLT